mmetsp:Transcript_18172/g.20980  ORF Transcript_18172/g.20980 Transcript_18172/m.20980 type:complete len:93 (+) Transcript_18172:68-346(+)|eukprot:CAMPEP_0194187504 /NCGR_PEP_ID=MMETSP0154-20130528/51156_1 /TAXON_ID=1049557 /ORGANISM="Thalassiothrix antarctica, Strain L6-D1" /LENGTH=92 /DNA_ID=CAMNT_0038907257 /DNA_START=56 /DNA_END=334 /DNA_ORIENTATION=+
MDDKISKLEQATENARKEVEEQKVAVEESEKAVMVAKALLRELSPEEQEKIQITDTKFPDLLASHQTIQDAYEVSVKKYETNMKYLKKFRPE